MKVFSIFLFLLIKITSNNLVLTTTSVTTSFYREGKIILGGLFPLHYDSNRTDNYSLLVQPNPPECVRYNFLGFRWFQAMVFAVEEINNRSDLLPNVSLGFQIFDTCNTNSRAVTQAIYMVENLRNSSAVDVSAVIGPTESTKSTITSNIFSVYDLPQISYASTSRILSRKKIYNSFFRTIPNDDEQTMAIVDLLLEYNWKWVGLIAGDDDYGRPATTRLKESAGKKNICIEYTGYVSPSMKPSELQQMAKEIRDFNATVFVVFISAAHFESLANELKKLNVRGKTWIASEAWATSDTIRRVDHGLFEGTLGIAVRGGPMPGFQNFLRSVSVQSQPKNPFLAEFFKNTFNCSCVECFNYDQSESELPSCSGHENFSMATDESAAYSKWEGEELEKSFNVYLAVYVVAYALENIMRCTPGSGLLKNGDCPVLDTLEPWQLLAYMRHVNFTQPGQDLPFFFDELGDPLASYKLVNWQRSFNGTELEFVNVGYYSSVSSSKWSMHQDVKFVGNTSTAPPSVCTEDCAAGFYRMRLSSPCCFECIQCPDNTISVKSNSAHCTPCNDLEYANSTKTGCIPRTQVYVRWNDGFGILFSFFVGFGICLTIFSAVVFYKNRNTPIVKATNVELSYLLFFSITCCFLTPLFYITEPQNWSCQSRVALFTLSFTFSVAAILVKTSRVIAAFKAKWPIRKKQKINFFRNQLQIAAVFIITLIQVALCTAWLLVDPSQKIEEASKTSLDQSLIQCTPGNIPLLISSYGYICFLALIAFVFAFRARKLPENFNEAKFITFSMLIFFIVWGSFIPAYLTTKGLLTTVVYCIAILTSSFAFLGCIFFPKLYVILFSPERNTKQEVHVSTASHVLRRTTAKYKKNSTTEKSFTQVIRSSADVDLMKGIYVSNARNIENSQDETFSEKPKKSEVDDCSLESNETTSTGSTVINPSQPAEKSCAASTKKPAPR